MELQFEFKVILTGYGKTRDEAWLNSVQEFCNDPGSPPDDEDTIEREEGDFKL